MLVRKCVFALGARECDAGMQFPAFKHHDYHVCTGTLLSPHCDCFGFEGPVNGQVAVLFQSSAYAASKIHVPSAALKAMEGWNITSKIFHDSFVQSWQHVQTTNTPLM